MTKSAKASIKTQSSFSIIVETENLGSAELGDLQACLDSIRDQEFPIEAANEILAVVGGHLSEESRALVGDQYPWVTIIPAESVESSTEAKYLGAQKASGEILVFADADMRYEPTWLGSLLGVFATHPDAGVVAGDTRVDTGSGYSLSLNLTWMFTMQPAIQSTQKTNSTFHINNYAMRRSLMLEFPFPTGLPFYRSHITVWKKRLLDHRVQIYRAPHASGFHTAPGSISDWWYRMLIFGRDFVAKADFSFPPDGKVLEKRSIAGRMRNLVKWVGWRLTNVVSNGRLLLHEDPRRLKYFPVGLVLSIINIAVGILGGLITLFSRDALLAKINAHEDTRIV